MTLYCPTCGGAVNFYPPMDTYACRHCGDYGHTEYLRKRPPAATRFDTSRARIWGGLKNPGEDVSVLPCVDCLNEQCDNPAHASGQRSKR